MQITLYSGFSKRPNSTLQPTGGTTITATLKERTSIENPTFLLAAGLSSYENITAVKWGSRYYFVSDITSIHNGLTEIACTLDRLATYKTEIGNAYCFIERCSYDYNENIADSATSTETTAYTVGLSSGAIFPNTPEKGVLVLHIASTDTSMLSGGGVGVVFVEPSIFTGNTNVTILDVMAKLWDDTVSQNLEKTLADAWSAIIRAVYIPCFTITDLATYPTFTKLTPLYLGKQAFNDLLPYKFSNSNGYPKCYEFTKEFDPETICRYSTFKWRNLPPYCNWMMYLPFYGPVDVAMDMFLNHGSTHPYLVVKASVDYCTGELVYTLYYRVYTGITPNDRIIAKYQTRMGVDIALSNIRQGNGMETLGHALSAVGGAVSMNPFQTVSEGVAGVISALQTQVSSIGNMSSGVGVMQAEFGTDNPVIRLLATGHETNQEPNAHNMTIGCPYMARDQISSHPGYIICSNASVSIPGTQADKDAVNAMLNNGFFFE